MRLELNGTSAQKADYKKTADYDYESRKFVLRSEDLA